MAETIWNTVVMVFHFIMKNIVIINPGSRPQKAAQGAKGAFVHGVAGRRTPLCGARRGQCRLNPVQNCKFWMQYCLLA